MNTKRAIYLVGLMIFAAALPPGCAATEDAPSEKDLNGEEQVSSASLAVVSQDEAEPNDSPSASGVRSMTMGDDNRGRFASSDAADYWKFELPARTYINLFLGEIPAGSDYDVALYRSSDLAHAVWTGAQPGNANEIVVRLDLQAGLYYVKVYPYSNPRSDVTYKLRYASTAVSRGWQWVDAGVPYCQAANGRYDSFCHTTCTRTGSAANPEWDRYRSDCSGFVSWAWALPPDGVSTSGIPGVAASIPSDSLMPGDALLLPGEHVVLFASWLDKATGRARLLEEPNCGLQARAVDVTLAPSSRPTVTLFGRTYTSYRRTMP